MRTLFSEYKTPTMSECENLGREIGLQKRVVQVWFQNARAKEKKKLGESVASIASSSVASNAPCKYCPDHVYSNKYSIQDHVFTRGHIDSVRNFIQGNSSGSISGGRSSRGQLNGGSGHKLTPTTKILLSGKLYYYYYYSKPRKKFRVL